MSRNKESEGKQSRFLLHKCALYLLLRAVYGDSTLLLPIRERNDRDFLGQAIRVTDGSWSLTCLSATLLLQDTNPPFFFIVAILSLKSDEVNSIQRIHAIEIP
jgi:hypothetical protein